MIVNKLILCLLIVSWAGFSGEEGENPPAGASTSVVKTASSASSSALQETTTDASSATLRTTKKSPQVGIAAGDGMLTTDVWVHILNMDRTCWGVCIWVCKPWQQMILDTTETERTRIQNWSSVISPWNLQETKKGMYRLIIDLPFFKNGELFSMNLRKFMNADMTQYQRLLGEWKKDFKDMELGYTPESLVYPHQPVCMAFSSMITARNSLYQFSFLYSYNIGKAVQSVVLLPKSPDRTKQDLHALKDPKNFHDLFEQLPKSPEVVMFKLAGSIYRGWRSLQPNSASLVEEDNATLFGRSILSSEISFDPEFYANDSTHLSKQIDLLKQQILDYTKNAEKASNALLVELIR